jgi:hypothetical protein
MGDHPDGFPGRGVARFTRLRWVYLSRNIYLCQKQTSGIFRHGYAGILSVEIEIEIAIEIEVFVGDFDNDNDFDFDVYVRIPSRPVWPWRPERRCGPGP